MKMQFNKSLISTLFVTASLMVTATATAAETVLVNKAGMTLYTFDVDTDGKSYCDGGCAVKWSPYLMKEGAKLKTGYGYVVRDDGSKQWTYQEKPLYTWIGDTAQGDMTGDGMGGVWHVAKKTGYSY
ncbi:hypothetical protein OAH87_00500 [Marinomonas sp.]|nr:hypothetical protein [Marinomonas sp.]MDB4836933.1 hypothetical protein [Marinomonas sp.]